MLTDDKYDWNDGEILLSSLVRGCQLTNDTIQTWLPIHGKLLELMLFELGRVFDTQPYLQLLYRTVFALGYYSLMWISELVVPGNHTVKAKNIHVARNKLKILIILYSSKTHAQESYPQKIHITGHGTDTNKFFCPFVPAKRYLKQRGCYESEDEPLFIFKDKSPVASHHLRGILKLLIHRLGLRPNLYQVHGLRSGCATDMFRAGYTIEEIKKLGRW